MKDLSQNSRPKAVLKTSKLAVGYRSKKGLRQIISNIDLDLIPGQLIGLVGINGSGKSTLLRTLSGLQAPLEGTIYLDNRLFQDTASEERARLLSVVLTGQYISKNLSVYELVALGRQPYTNWLGRLTVADKSKINDALDATELNALAHQKCHSLSDGQLQRALVARALAQDTQLIFLDEPTTHLDLHHKASILNLLQKICVETGKTILFSSHDIELIIPLCDRMIVLKEASLTLNTPEKLVENGIFSALFPEKIIGFDPENSRFFLKK